MVDAVIGINAARQRIERQQPAQADPLSAKRAEESRRLVLAAVQQQHRANVARAISTYMNFKPPVTEEAAQAAMPLAQAKSAYEQF